MPVTPLRYGIVGTGLMGREHLRILALIPEVEAVAICDPHSASIEEALKITPDADTYDDFSDFLNRDDLDVVVVATPNHTHAEIVTALVQKGPHLLIEKPMANTIQDAKTLHSLLSDYQSLAWIGMEYRYAPPVAQAIKRSDSGEIGTLRMLSIREHRYPFLPKIDDWNRFNKNTGGTLVEKCCHFFDLMRHILKSEPTQIFASGAIDVNHLNETYDEGKPDIIDNALVIVDFESGARASLDLCMFAEQSTDQTEIHFVGDAGKIECRQPANSVTIGLRHEGWENWAVGAFRDSARLRTDYIDIATDISHGHGGATFHEHQAFLRAIQQSQRPSVSSLDGLMAVLMGAAAEISIRQNRVVHMSELTDY